MYVCFLVPACVYPPEERSFGLDPYYSTFCFLFRDQFLVRWEQVLYCFHLGEEGEGLR